MNNIWYDPSEILSYNKKYNFVDGIRGRGKTYAFKKFAINQFLRKGHKTVWLRYNETQKRDGRDNFLVDLIPNEGELFDKNSFHIDRDTLYINNKETIVFRSVSKASKSKSVVYDEAFKYIIYDEYITEYTATEDLLKVMIVIETIERMRDDVRHIYLGNAITRNNPFFEIHNIKLKDLRTKEFVKTRDCVVHSDLYNQDFKDIKLQTKSGQMQMAQGYGAHSIEGEYLLDDYEKITGAKTRKKKLLFIVDDVAVWLTSNEEKEEVLWCSNIVINFNHKVQFNTLTNMDGQRKIGEFPQVLKLLNYHSFEGTLYFHTLHSQQKILSTL